MILGPFVPRGLPRGLPCIFDFIYVDYMQGIVGIFSTTLIVLLLLRADVEPNPGPVAGDVQEDGALHSVLCSKC